MNRGQYIRLLLSTTANPATVIAAAKQMSLHLSAQTEESSTKDTTGDAEEYEVVGQSYEITGSGLVLTDNDDLLTGGVGLNSFEDWVANVTTSAKWSRPLQAASAKSRTCKSLRRTNRTPRTTSRWPATVPSYRGRTNHTHTAGRLHHTWV